MKPPAFEGDPIGWYLVKFSVDFWYPSIAGIDLEKISGEGDASHNLLIHL